MGLAVLSWDPRQSRAAGAHEFVRWLERSLDLKDLAWLEADDAALMAGASDWLSLICRASRVESHLARLPLLAALRDRPAHRRRARRA